MAQRGHTNVDVFKDEAPVQIQNNFVGGLKTEFTGMNFPPNACTETNNVVFSQVGDITRRKGFNFENNYATLPVDRTEKPISTHHWLNAGGDGETQIYVLQIGNLIYFYRSSDVLNTTSLSQTVLPSQIDLTPFVIPGNDPSLIEECNFSDGNGYLFIYNSAIDPVYCTYAAGVITPAKIDIKIRDFIGFPETTDVTVRPATLTPEHNYNLENQGWSEGVLWDTGSFQTFLTGTGYPPLSFTGFGYTGFGPTLGNQTVSVPAGLPIEPGQACTLNYNVIVYSYNIVAVEWFDIPASGTANCIVVSYSGTSLTVNITEVIPVLASSAIEYTFAVTPWTIDIKASPTIDTIDTWHSAIGNYPSNADVWFDFLSVETKTLNSSGGSTATSTPIFDPATTILQPGRPSSPAPKGHFILNAFKQVPDAISNIVGLTSTITSVRPRTGAWFQGRVFYAGVDASQQAQGDQNFYTWTENIYFSRIIDDVTQFGQCYQLNDPTDQKLFDLLPDDGGVIVIQGCGAIEKLFPIQNGMLVFAANGIWFITGSTGVGFTATDYTITKISAVRNISSNSYIDVNGLPVFWNEEGIYFIHMSNEGLLVEPVTVKTIKSFYNAIPMISKRFARGSYNPVSYIIQWLYRSTPETDLTSRYEFDSILCYNTITQAFYTYSIIGPPYMHAVSYISYPGDKDAPDPTFKYVTSWNLNPGQPNQIYNFTFSEEWDIGYVDWYSYDQLGVMFDSHFVTGYSLSGQGIREFQPGYIYVYSKNEVCTSYEIQGIWNFASSGNSGKYSTKQVITNNKPNFGVVYRRHRIRGHGEAIQLKFGSNGACPFDIIGWAIWETQSTGV